MNTEIKRQFSVAQMKNNAMTMLPVSALALLAILYGSWLAGVAAAAVGLYMYRQSFRQTGGDDS
jgi:hypothetical protein